MLIQSNILISEVELSEKQLQNKILDIFQLLFPNFILIKTEYALSGDVRKFGVNGRIDILALNCESNSLVIFELKKNNDKNIFFQVMDYSDFVIENISTILLKSKLEEKLKSKILEENRLPEIILIAHDFNHPTIRRFSSLKNQVRVLRYKYFDGDFILFEELKDYNTPQKKIGFTAEKEDISIEDFEELILYFFKYANNDIFVVDNRNIFINPTRMHEEYVKIAKKFEMPIFSKYTFFTYLKKTKFYISSKKSFRYKNTVTSVVVLKINSSGI